MRKAVYFRDWCTVCRLVVFLILAVAFGMAVSAEPAPAVESSSAAKVKWYETFADGPAAPAIGQIYHNAGDNTDYIYNGRIWVPHDKRADDIDYDQVRKDLAKEKEVRK